MIFTFDSSSFHAAVASKSHSGSSAARFVSAPSTLTGDKATFTSSCSPSVVENDARAYLSPTVSNFAKGFENSAAK